LTSSTPGHSRLRVALIVAVIGAVLILLGFIGTGAEAAGAGAILLAALLTAGPYSQGSPGAVVNWWRLLAAGAILALVGVPLSLALETIGGLIAGAGAALAIVGAAFGWR
jgi:hypothetical protein